VFDCKKKEICPSRTFWIMAACSNQHTPEVWSDRHMLQVIHTAIMLNSHVTQGTLSLFTISSNGMQRNV
jgi:hypothetical protein